MPWNWKKILVDIDRKRLPNGVKKECLSRKNGAFLRLLSEVESGHLTENQLTNALALLLMLRMYNNNPENRQRHYDLLRQFCTDIRLRVRDRAIFGIFHIASMEHEYPNSEYIQTDSKEVFRLAFSCLEKGVLPETKEWIEYQINKRNSEPNAEPDPTRGS